MSAHHEEKIIKVSPERLYNLMNQKLQAAGLDQDQAEETAKHLTFADMSGIHSHGAVRVEYYAERINKGGITNQPNISFEQTGPSTGIFHGDNAQGHFVANKALVPAIGMAKESGVAVVGISKMGHSGTLSYYMRKIADANLVVVPFGGAENYFGTNPIAFCAPNNGDEPLIFDMATTVQAWGKILDARSKGIEIPNNWAVDQKGHPTTDPNQVNGLLPISGPKGYGLMMMVDILAGVLLGLPSGNEVSSMYHNLHEGRNLGQMFILIDPEKFVGIEPFKAQITNMMRNLTQIIPAPGFDSVQYPGQPGNEAYNRAKIDGIEIPKSIFNYLESDEIHFDNYEGMGAFAN